MNIDYLNLNTFLDFGYFLKYDNAQKLIDYSSADPSSLKNVSYIDLLKMGCELFQKAIDEQFVPGSDVCVPLSGGIDSRAILGGLLKCTEAKNIHTYTFGVPGAWDYEFGKLVSESVGTHHTQIDLNEYKYTQDELLDISRRVDMQTMLFLHPPLYIIKRFENMEIWTGLGLDHLFGDHYPEETAQNFKDAAVKFLTNNKYVKSINLLNIDKEQFIDYIDVINSTDRSVPWELIIDFENRQSKYVKPHVCMEGFKYRSLLQSKELVAFALSLDAKYLKGQSLYKDIVLNLYSDLFGLPCTRSAGLPLTASSLSVNLIKVYHYLKLKCGMRDVARVNYMDFNRAILQNNSLQQVIISMINDLVSRKIVTWIDPLQILDDHLKGKGKHADALLVLASLEVHLKNEREI